MAIPIITKGATTSHGGVITECVATFRVHGQGVHVDCMTHYCPKCKQTVNAIASNHTKNVYGRAIILEGDKTSCGARFIANQGVARIAGGSSVSSNESSSASNKDKQEDSKYYLRYIVLDQNNETLAYRKCLLFKPDGTTEVHTTNHEGKLKLIIDDTSKEYELHVIVNDFEDEDVNEIVEEGDI